MLRRLSQVTFNNFRKNNTITYLSISGFPAERRTAATITTTTTRAAQSTPPTTGTAQKWDVYAGVLVERLPIVSKTLNNIERQFQELLWRIEYENSLKSNHELQYERETVQRDLIKKGEAEVDLEESSTKLTAQDLKDAYIEELKKFEAATRTTPDDAKNLLTSTDRSLEDSLYLVIQEKLGNQMHFLLPQGQRLDGETMRQTAERIINEKFNNNLQVNFLGNAPCGFYKYKYPIGLRQNSIGAKVFFYHATLKQSNLNDPKACHFEWLTKENLAKKLTNASYAESVQKFIL